jgi:hypothetical protein
MPVFTPDQPVTILHDGKVVGHGSASAVMPLLNGRSTVTEAKLQLEKLIAQDRAREALIRADAAETELAAERMARTVDTVLKFADSVNRLGERVDALAARQDGREGRGRNPRC